MYFIGMGIREIERRLLRVHHTTVIVIHTSIEQRHFLQHNPFQILGQLSSRNI